jgi:hypothetical protein
LEEGGLAEWRAAMREDETIAEKRKGVIDEYIARWRISVGQWEDYGMKDRRRRHKKEKTKEIIWKTTIDGPRHPHRRSTSHAKYE